MTTAEKVAIPSAPGVSDNADAIISIRNLRKWYQVGGGFLGFGNKIFLKAVDDVSFDIERNKRSEEHTSELQSLVNLVCRLLLEKKKI